MVPLFGHPALVGWRRTSSGVRRRETLRKLIEHDARPGVKAPRRRTDSTSEPAVPAVLPLVVAEAHGEELHVVVNGNKEQAETVPRAGLGGVLARLVAGFGVPTRVEVHEQDGTVHADIVQPPPPEPIDPQTPDPYEPEHSAAPELVELRADGFVPGEEVAVALVVRLGSAGAGGSARAVIDLAEIGDPGSAEVVLVGRISGETAFRSLT